MPPRRCSDADFIQLIESVGPAKTAEQLGIKERGVYERRVRLEEKIGRQIKAPEYQNSNTRLAEPHPNWLTFANGRLLWPEIVPVTGEGEVQFRGKVVRPRWSRSHETQASQVAEGEGALLVRPVLLEKTYRHFGRPRYPTVAGQPLADGSGIHLEPAGEWRLPVLAVEIPAGPLQLGWSHVMGRRSGIAQQGLCARLPLCRAPLGTTPAGALPTSR